LLFKLKNIYIYTHINKNKKMSEFDIIVAMTEKYGIGKNNSIPWVIKKDIEYFKNITTKTFDLTK